jgi:hypothetical protein
MVIERLGHPEKFVRITEAVNGLPAPPVCSGIPAESPRVPACLRLRECRRDPIVSVTDANLR